MIAALFFLLVSVLLVPYLRIVVMGAPIYITMPAAALVIFLAMRTERWAWSGVRSIAGFFLMFLVALVISTIYQIVNLGGLLYASYAILSRALAALVLPAVVVLLTKRLDRLTTVIKMWTFLATLVAIWAILQVVVPSVMTAVDRLYYFTLSKITTTELLHGRAEYATARAIAGLWNPNVAGTALVLSLPMALTVVARAGKVKALIAVVIVLAGIVATGSRQAMLGVVVCLFVLFLPRLRALPARLDVSAGLAFTVFLVLLVVGVLVFLAFDYGRAQINRLIGGIGDGIAARWDNYQRFAKTITAHPLTAALGKGPNAREVSWREGSLTWSEGYVSNSWLLLIFEFGALGFIAFTGMFITIWRVSTQRWAKACLATMAWLMLCDNAMHSLMCTQTLASLCLALGLLAGQEVQRVESLQAQWQYKPGYCPSVEPYPVVQHETIA